MTQRHEIRFRSLMHMNDDEGISLSELMRDVRRNMPHAADYFERLWLRQVLRTFYVKLARHERERLRNPEPAPRPRPYTLRELAEDVERLRASRRPSVTEPPTSERISGIRLRTDDDVIDVTEEVEEILDVA